MALLNRDQIFQAQDITYEDVAVPEWSPPGGEVACIRIRGLSGTERDKFEENSLVKGKKGARDVNMRNIRARLVAECAINEDGSPLFQPGDVLTLGQKSAAALDRCFKAAQRLSGMSDDDIEELVEDFEDDPSGPSTSASPGTSASPSPSSSPASPPAS